MEETSNLPPSMVELAKVIGIEPITCRKATCNGLATTYSFCADVRYDEGECLVFSCPRSSTCKGKTWAHCTTCKKTFGANALGKHVRSEKHKSNKEDQAGSSNKRPRRSEHAVMDFSSMEPSHTPTAREQSTPAFPGNTDDVESVVGNASFGGMSVADMSTNALLDSLDEYATLDGEDAIKEKSKVDCKN